MLEMKGGSLAKVSSRVVPTDPAEEPWSMRCSSELSPAGMRELKYNIRTWSAGPHKLGLRQWAEGEP